jgi:hypothetical protein
MTGVCDDLITVPSNADHTVADSFQPCLMPQILLTNLTGVLPACLPACLPADMRRGVSTINTRVFGELLDSIYPLLLPH